MSITGDAAMSTPVPRPASSVDYETRRKTFTYKTTERGLDIQLDVQLPLEEHLPADAKCPVLVSFHGGGA
jgi:hypothetical protein